MTRNLKQLLSTVTVVVLAGGPLAGCLGGSPAQDSTPPSPTTPLGNSSDMSTPSGTASASPGQTFDHMNDSVDPFQVLNRIQEQGPPEFSTRMHSCAKMKYATLGNVLGNLGIDPTMGGDTTAAGLFRNGASALGRPDYANRIPETVELSTAGAVRTYDIFVAAAPMVIAAMPNIARCKVGGTGTQMFDASGSCTLNGIACLTGAKATAEQKTLCDSAVSSNTTDKVGMDATAPTVGQVVAVSALLAAAHSCE